MSFMSEEIIKEAIEVHHNANRVTYETIAALLDNAETQELVFHGKTLVVSYQLECGFTLRGEGSVVDPANFNIEIGRQVARQNVENQLWQLEGYRLQWKLFEEGDKL